MSRVQLALNVADLEVSVDFYTIDCELGQPLIGAKPASACC